MLYTNIGTNGIFTFQSSHILNCKMSNYKVKFANLPHIESMCEVTESNGNTGK